MSHDREEDLQRLAALNAGLRLAEWAQDDGSGRHTSDWQAWAADGYCRSYREPMAGYLRAAFEKLSIVPNPTRPLPPRPADPAEWRVADLDEVRNLKPGDAFLQQAGNKWSFAVMRVPPEHDSCQWCDAANGALHVLDPSGDGDWIGLDEWVWTLKPDVIPTCPDGYYLIGRERLLDAPPDATFLIQDTGTWTDAVWQLGPVRAECREEHEEDGDLAEVVSTTGATELVGRNEFVWLVRHKEP